MASVQLVSDVRCQSLIHCAASYGERGSVLSLSHRRNHGYRRISNCGGGGVYTEGNFKEHNNIMEQGKDAKHSTTKLGRRQKLRRLGFSYLASSFLYMLTKVKALYNGFPSSGGGESRMGIEAPKAEAYFSVPVLPN